MRQEIPPLDLSDIGDNFEVCAIHNLKDQISLWRDSTEVKTLA